METATKEIVNATWIKNQLYDVLKIYRETRQFDAKRVLDLKLKEINAFFTREKLNAAVIGISGGLDSAVALRLLERASRVVDSPIERIEACILPIKCSGTSDQSTATRRAWLLAEKKGEFTTFKENDLSPVVEAYLDSYAIEEYINDPWTIGQLASIVRTPFLYMKAAELQLKSLKSIVVGTTNRDEGAYIGFYGKASDAMNDLQPIGDLHKSEVIALAELLKVPAEIINAVPKGDVWDGSSDEETIGAPYWFLELYLNTKRETYLEFKLNEAINNMPLTDSTVIHKWIDNIENIHRKNKHKYDVGLPAHFIDVMDRTIPGGWRD